MSVDQRHSRCAVSEHSMTQKITRWPIFTVLCELVNRKEKRSHWIAIEKLELESGQSSP
jgi:hypothetical protein